MRKKPYTEIGVRRIPCARCGEPSVHQWKICADGSQYRGICNECDIGMNTVIMRYVFGDNEDTEKRLEAYRVKVSLGY